MNALKRDSKTSQDNNKATQPKIDQAAAFRVGMNILDKWDCSVAQKTAILAMSKATFYRNMKNNDAVNLSQDQLERLSYIVNMHQALRMVFTNPDNLYGFMKMKNNNPYFNGRTPLSLIEKGNFGILYEVFKRIDAMRNGQW